MITIKDITRADLTKDMKVIESALGLEKTLMIIKKMERNQVKIMSQKNVDRYYRNIKIKKEFNGFNSLELARKYNLTDASIRNIIMRKDNNMFNKNDELLDDLAEDELEKVVKLKGGTKINIPTFETILKNARKRIAKGAYKDGNNR